MFVTAAVGFYIFAVKMRKDIHVNTYTGDIVFQNTYTAPSYPFRWVAEGDMYLFGEVRLPASADLGRIAREGVLAEIPYTPVYKPMKIRTVKYSDELHQSYVMNPVNGSEWFDAEAVMYGNGRRQLKACQLPMVDDGTYLLRMDGAEGKMEIWSGKVSDFRNIPANIQNRNLLLKCVPSNNYRYPTSGVGLIRFLHSTLNNSVLAYTLQTEFAADKVYVNSAEYDAETGELMLDLDFTEADASV